ncbi:hypothetical protein JCM11641_006969 [Rhodosporidiobolus odoratus]
MAPLHLDHSHSTYLVLSTSSSAPPTLPSTLSTRLTYLGPVGSGTMANEHVFQLATLDKEVAQRVESELSEAKVGRVEVMKVDMRTKR